MPDQQNKVNPYEPPNVPCEIPRQKKRAARFTLIELLVVIACIAIVLALLY